MDKPLSEMSFDEKINWATGTLVLSIGEGKFRGEVAFIIQAISQEAYNRGIRDGGKITRA